MRVSPEQRRYLIGLNCIGAAFANALINGAFGWVITYKLAEFPMWKFPGAFWDLVATAFGVTFGTCVGAALQVPKDVAKNKASLPELTPAVATALGRFPDRLFKRALCLGLISIPVSLPLVVVPLMVSGEAALDRTVFIAVKAGFAAIQGAIVTPFIVLRALVDLSRKSLPA